MPHQAGQARVSVSIIPFKNPREQCVAIQRRLEYRSERHVCSTCHDGSGTVACTNPAADNASGS